MKKLLSLFVKYPFYGKIFILIFITVGVFAMMSMPKASFPVVESRIINISVTYQGATPKEMEEGVVTLVENSLRGIIGIKEYSSVSMENSAKVTVTMKNGYDIDKVLYDVKNAVDGISNFPAGAEQPIIAKSRTTTTAMFISLFSENGDLIELKDEAYRIESDFLNSGKISQISISGFPTRMEMSIEIDETNLERYGISISEVQSAVGSYNIDSYAGVIKNPDEHIKINIRNRSVKPEDIEQIIVRSSENGGEVRVGDIAKVVLQFEDTPSMSYVNGERNVLIFIQNIKEEDLAETSEFVNDYIEKYNAKTGGFQIVVIRDFLQVLNGQLSILYGNGIQGVLLVILTLSLFLNYRISLWVAWGIPAAFLGMFAVAYMAGISLNMISLFGMILIIGILVDDGIVIGENIFTYYEKGYSPRVAAIKGTLEVLPAVFVSVATTIVAFLPLLFVQGNLEMMYEMAVVVIACLVFSVIEGMFVLPGHLASPKILRPENPRSIYGKVRGRFDRWMSYACNNLYVPFLKWTLSHKVIVIAVATSMFIVTTGLFLGGRLKFTFFPSSNEDNFTIDLAMKPGTNSEKVLDILKHVEVKVKEADSVLIATTGEESFIVNMNRTLGTSFSSNESGEHAGQLRIFLRGLDQSTVNSDYVKKVIGEQIGNIPEAYKFAVGASNRFGAPVSISLFSKDNTTLVNASNDLKAELGKIQALSNIIDNNQLGTREVHLKLKPLAYTLNLTPQNISTQVRAAFYGSLAQRIQEGRSEIWFYVRYPLENRLNIGDLESMKIRTANGGEYPLSQVCDFNIQRGVTKINHYNAMKEIRIEGFMLNPKDSVLPILEDIDNTIMPDLMSKYPGLTYIYQGQVKDSQEEMENITVLFSFAFFVILLILIINFRSFTQGLLVISMIPLSFVAAIWGHLLENTILSMMSIWGMIALSGTIINNAVVFMSRYNDFLKSGYTVVNALVETGRSRFRPIVLTSATTIMGLFPLIKETSSDATFVKPMAISLGYGILIGTILILAIFPTLVKSANTFNILVARLKGKKNVTPESVETANISLQIDKEVDEALERENFNINEI